MQQQELQPENENIEFSRLEIDDSPIPTEYINRNGDPAGKTEVQKLCQDLPEEILSELNEDPEKTAECIESIRYWINNNKEFYGRTDDGFILRFLRVCKFDLDKTKQRIRRHYQSRHKYSKYYHRTEESELMMEEIFGNKLGYLMNFAGNCQENLVISRIGCYRDTYTLDQCMNGAAAQVGELMMEDPRTQANGVVAIFDYTGISMSFALQMTPAACWRLLNMSMFSSAIRVKGMHVINASSIAMKIVYLVKFFLGKKMADRLHVHKDMDSLYQHVSPEYLPFEFGGTAGPEQQFVESTIQWFRNGKAINAKNDLYGINKCPQQTDDLVLTE